MVKRLTSTGRQAQKLEKRIAELERKLAEARMALRSISGSEPGSIFEPASEPNDHLNRALFDAPYPLMIRRDDGRVMMINAAWTAITGYTLEDIPTITEWARKAYGENAEQQITIISGQGFSQTAIKKWGEFEVRTKSGQKRIWDFSTAPMGVDQNGHELVMTMAVDVTERKQTENALVESERQQRETSRLLELDRARLTAILEHLPVGIWITDADGKLVGKNEAADRIWAGDAPLLDNIHEYPQYVTWYPDTGKLLEPEEYPVARVLSTGQPVDRVETNIRRFDGSQGTVLISAVPIKDNDGQLTGVVAINVDITSRKQAEQAVRDSEERFSKTFLKAPFGMNITRWSDGMILDVNDAWLNMLGWTREEVLGKTTADFPFYANLKDRALVRQRIMNNESLSDIELELVRKDGTIRTVTVATTIIEIQGERCILGVLNDITDRSHAEEALRESEHRYRELFEMMQEGLVAGEVITDDQFNPIDYRYLDVNPATERQFGIPREQFIGRTYTDVLPDGDREWIDILGHVALTGEPASVERYSQGRKRWFEAHAYSPRAGQFVNIMTDISERKNAQEALQASEAKLRAVFRALVEGVVFLNPQGEVEDINPAVQHTYGHTLEELTDPERDPRNTIIRPDGTPFRVEEQPAIVALRTGEAVQNVEMGVKSVDGKVSWRLVNAQPVYNDAGTLLGAVASLFDITERRKSEEALRQSEERFSKAFHSSPNAIIISRLSDGLIIEVNDGWTRIFGHEPSEVVGHTSLELGAFAHPGDRAKAIALLQEHGMLHDFELQIRTKSGAIRDASMSVERIEVNDMQCLLTVMQDITERKHAEDALRESEQRFHSLADSMPQLIWTALPDGTVDYYNKRYLEYQDIKQVMKAVWEWAPVLHPDDADATVKAWQHSVSTGELYQIEHRVRMAGGLYRWHLSRGVPTYDEQGRIVRWFGTATDIHEQKTAEEKLKIYTERLERSNRELEQFAFMASHDLQEPLRKIQAFGDLLMERAQTLNDQELEYVKRMRSAAGRMREMVNGLLHLSRVNTQGSPFTTVDLLDVTAGALSDQVELIEKTNGVVEVAPLPTVTGDALQLRQLMQNLIGNALKYHRPEMYPRVRIHAQESDSAVKLFVQDNGIGFDQENAERIFQPFQRLVGRSQYEGSGMGLAICRRIVERHAGEIRALSKPGEGTTIVVILPKAPAAELEKDNHE